MPRYFLEISYEGTYYHGWQAQPNAVSVQGVLNDALSKLLRHPVETVASGRTDTGVHCLSQFVHFDTDMPWEAVSNLPFRLNVFLPQDIAIKGIKPVPAEAHARFSALSRAYRYHIHQEKDPFAQLRSWHFHRPLRLDLMQEACSILRQHSDFEALSKANSDVHTHQCHIMEARWETLPGNRLVFYVKANRFLRGMVRLIVGAMVEIGTEKMTLAQFDAFLSARQRLNQRQTAPAHGLYLCEVEYPEGI